MSLENTARSMSYFVQATWGLQESTVLVLWNRDYCMDVAEYGMAS